VLLQQPDCPHMLSLQHQVAVLARGRLDDKVHRRRGGPAGAGTRHGGVKVSGGQRSAIGARETSLATGCVERITPGASRDVQ